VGSGARVGGVPVESLPESLGGAIAQEDQGAGTFQPRAIFAKCVGHKFASSLLEGRGFHGTIGWKSPHRPESGRKDLWWMSAD